LLARAREAPAKKVLQTVGSFKAKGKDRVLSLGAALVVARVEADGPAAAQVELSDVIVAVNGTPVGAETSSELLHLIGGAGPTGRPGARQRSVELTIVRPVPEASVKKKKGLLGRMKSGGAKMLGLKKSKK